MTDFDEEEVINPGLTRMDDENTLTGYRLPHREGEDPLKVARPVAPLKLVVMESASQLGAQVNKHLVDARKASVNAVKNDVAFLDYAASDFRLFAELTRFGNGESRAKITRSVRGKDLFIMTDVMNHSISYEMYGFQNYKSPDDHFQDCKRVIAALSGHCHRVNLIMPFLYESRQHRRSGRESLDCATAIGELSKMGVENIITFDVHDPRVLNSIPLTGVDNIVAFDYYLDALLDKERQLLVDRDHFVVICPDEGSLERGIFLSTAMSVNTGMFYKRRDYSRLEDGKNPIVAHEYLGDSIDGKDLIIIDDIISSGDSMLDTARLLKEKGAGKVYLCVTFALFTNGLESFDKAYENCIFERIISTNLAYSPPELKMRPYYIEADMSKFLARVINYLNHDLAVANALTSARDIKRTIKRYNERRT